MAMERRCFKALGAGDAFTGGRGLLVVFLAEINDTRATHKGVGAYP